MTVNYTTNLALGQPVTGTESGTWGDDVNNAVTSYLDIAIAGGLAITVTTADVTLTITQGTSVATNIGSTTAQYAILNVSGAMTAARNLIVPSSSRQYVINNACTGGFLLTVKGSATTGVTLVNGEKAHVFWNGTDYSKLSNTPGGAGTFSSITNTGLTSGRVVFSTTGGLETDSANLLYSGTDLTVYGLTVGRGAGAVAGNTAVGVSALAGNSTGARLTAVGASAGVLNTASDNSFVGYNAGTTNTSGINNTALGSQALYTNSVGGNNTAIGYTALLLNTGSNNTAVGGGPYPYATLGNNSSGAANTAVGTSALAQNTTGSNNTAVGYQAGYTGTTGAQNTFIGRKAGFTANGSYNTAIGDSAGTLLTTGTANTFIGCGASNSAGADITMGSKNTIIGAYGGNSGGLDIRTASNYIVLSDGDGNPRGIFDSSGNLGLGVTPSASNLPTFQSTVAILVGSSETDVTSNAYYNSGWKYVGTGLATQYQANSGLHKWFTAPSGTNAGDPITFTQAMTLDSSGNLLVGTTDSGRTTGAGVKIGTPGGTTAGTISVVKTASSGADDTYNLYSTGAAAYRFYVTTAGQIFATNITISAISDIRFKENVRDLNVGLSEVLALKPRLYDWKEGKGADIKNARGFIAQEFEEVFPDLIDDWKDPAPEGEEPYKSVRQDLIPVLVKAIQEQQALITQLTARITALETA